VEHPFGLKKSLLGQWRERVVTNVQAAATKAPEEIETSKG
jgi:uncharacterized protein YueI